MPLTPPAALSGTQTFLRHGRYSAAIASVGASLRSLRWDDRDLVMPFMADEVRPAYRGAILAPWPNRVIDGRYSFNGIKHRLSITEPARGHALHGLLAWQDWAIDSSTTSAVVLSSTLVAQQGYPFTLLMQVRYELGDNGLTTTIAAVNIGRSAAPYGTAAHPYLVAGKGTVDDWVLEVPAHKVLGVTEDRLIPTGLAEVGSPGVEEFDFREPRHVGPVRIDHAFTGLIRNDKDEATVRLVGKDNTGTAITWDTGCPWVQIHTADAPEAGARSGLAVEPMTCPPDAFNNKADLTVLEPGGTHTASWTIQAIN